jgi:hypothetical protein
MHAVSCGTQLCAEQGRPEEAGPTSPFLCVLNLNGQMPAVSS